MPPSQQVELVSVFAAGAGGGNPAPIVVDAAGMSDAQMQEVARHYGHESGFILPAPPGSGCDYEFRFWVPNHEMPMCGHVTVGAAWLLHQTGRLRHDRLTVQTRSGQVRVRITGSTTEGAAIEVSQPVGRVEPLPEPELSRDEILDALGISVAQLAPLPIQNACTSRVKTLIPLASCADLDALAPRFEKIEALCERIGSTGLYPYAIFDAGRQIFDARQFPRASGYPEDAATGIAASALSFGLLINGMVQASTRTITIRQGRAMKRPSQISVRFSFEADAESGVPDGCWLGGTVRFEAEAGAPS
ncbi:phenazine biosynthesis protein PhzF [Paraburkholderia ginsengiterrae]|uniref:Phenazine biosynthesis protein PhzF n=1 Tax=Paraburkholderia ginsengiterrae TaxID=1462993 RepID=A0A1A9MWS3_9BURK|nr:PhzF family phenazine biosynthesis isomerase [Paraburkholderia ginsengiterrae]OAJ52314.1 phenazine biosynthesis protein PhzF [Paraburkholderia ginsengiterrae]OAJ53571.1 phenazine biosynthesis protein PhzF [Paraburkholderia ginsengiterrae]